MCVAHNHVLCLIIDLGSHVHIYVSNKMPLRHQCLRFLL